jgi:hypothetical protein
VGEDESGVRQTVQANFQAYNTKIFNKKTIYGIFGVICSYDF